MFDSTVGATVQVNKNTELKVIVHLLVCSEETLFVLTLRGKLDEAHLTMKGQPGVKFPLHP